MKVKKTVTLDQANSTTKNKLRISRMFNSKGKYSSNLCLALGQAITNSTSCNFPRYHDNLNHYGFRLLETSQEAFFPEKKKNPLILALQKVQRSVS